MKNFFAIIMLTLLNFIPGLKAPAADHVRYAIVDATGRRMENLFIDFGDVFSVARGVKSRALPLWLKGPAGSGMLVPRLGTCFVGSHKVAPEAVKVLLSGEVSLTVMQGLRGFDLQILVTPPFGVSGALTCRDIQIVLI